MKFNPNNFVIDEVLNHLTKGKNFKFKEKSKKKKLSKKKFDNLKKSATRKKSSKLHAICVPVKVYEADPVTIQL